jgi:transcriptional regulator with XRE-family HTH domain
MASRSVITARQRRLGAELRKLREKAGLTLRAAAKALGIAESKLSSTEAGRVGVSAERVRYLAGQYRCDDGALVDALAAMATERENGWWEEYRGRLPDGFLDLAEFERHARRVRSFETVDVPGMLQSEEHMRALYAGSSDRMSQEQQDLRVEFRLRRQAVLEGADYRYRVVVHEAALRIRKGDRGTAQRQLLHILRQSERPQVSVRVVPFDRDRFTISSPVLLLDGPVPQLDTALGESPHGGELLNAETRLSVCRRTYDAAHRAALGVVESRSFIQDLAEQM